MSEEPTYLSSGVSSIDRLLEGGFECGTMSSIHSDANIGKSWMNLQLAMMTNLPIDQGGLDAPALIIDTEGFYSQKVLNRLLGFYQKRFNVSEEDFRIDVIQLRNIDKLYHFFGLKPNVTMVKDKMQANVITLNKPKKTIGKNVVEWFDHVESSDAWKLCENIGYKYIGIDSITMPLKAKAFPSSLSWLSGRAALLTPFMNTLNDLSIRQDVVTFCIHHLVKSDVTKQQSGWGHAWGGEIIKYVTKRMMLLMKPTKEETDTFGFTSRRLNLYRLPGSMSRTIAVDLAKDIGFVDVMPHGSRKTKG
jgi:RecA/RadA recombinase